MTKKKPKEPKPIPKEKQLEKCGKELYVCFNHILKLIDTSNPMFEEFLTYARERISESVSIDDCLEMLSQHIILKDIINSLFKEHYFYETNPLAKLIEFIVSSFNITLEDDIKKLLTKVTDTLKKLYNNCTQFEDRQTLMENFFGKVFYIAFNKTYKRLGIIYTPKPVTDYMLLSTHEIMQSRFNRSLSDKDVMILDPAAGVGTFISRLLISGIIRKEDLKRKYENELQCNEITLLGYYIGSLNIQETYYHLTNEYIPFKGMQWTNTLEHPER